MPKRTSLDSLELEPQQDEVAAESAIAANPKSSKTVQQTAYLPKPVHEQLRRLAFDERHKMHDYLMEGLDLVFQKRGLPSLNELKQDTTTS